MQILLHRLTKNGDVNKALVGHLNFNFKGSKMLLNIRNKNTERLFRIISNYNTIKQRSFFWGGGQISAKKY